MTRLKENDIAGIAAGLRQYDEELLRKTGRSLLGIACHAVGVEEKETRLRFQNLEAAAIPITKGMGIIGGFAATVAAILRHLGIGAYVTGKTDGEGVVEAQEKKTNILFAADDDRFVVLHLGRRISVDNAAATGKGFAAGLDLLCGGVKGEKVLVLGCGPVGLSAVQRLFTSGAVVSVFDIVPGRCSCLGKANIHSYPLHVANNFETAMAGHRLIIDATNAGGIIGAEWITSSTFIAAPGMPMGLTAAALEKVGDRILHDPLQLGVAVMAVEAVY